MKMCQRKQRVAATAKKLKDRGRRSLIDSFCSDVIAHLRLSLQTRCSATLIIHLHRMRRKRECCVRGPEASAWDQEDKRHLSLKTLILRVNLNSQHILSVN